ncbi:MAG: hypothetical protein AABO58_22410 [Acidobacteriota bacterium]
MALFGPSPEPLDPEIEQQVGKAEQLAARAPLETGQSGLRGEAGPLIARGTAEGDLEGGIVTKGVGVGGVFIAGADLQDALKEQITDGVADLAALSRIDHRAGQAPGKLQVTIDLPEQNHAGVGAELRFIEGGGDRAAIDGKEVGLRSTLCHDAGTSFCAGLGL